MPPTQRLRPDAAALNSDEETDRDPHPNAGPAPAALARFFEERSLDPECVADGVVCRERLFKTVPVAPGQTLASVDWAELQFLADANAVPDYFVFVRVPTDDGISVPEPQTVPRLAGFVPSYALSAEPAPGVLTLRRGDVVSGRTGPVLTDAYGIPLEGGAPLRTDWDALCAELLHDPAEEVPGFIPPGIVHPDPTESAGRTSGVDELTGPDGLPLRYSLAASGTEVPTPDDFVRLLRRGIKVILFAPEDVLTALTTARDAAFPEGHPARSGFNQCLCAVASDGHVPNFAAADGRLTDKTKRLLTEAAGKADNFNLEQYFVEHAPTEGTVIVTAGAGTGKTTVMIDRIAFLFATVDDLHPADVAMITFTNKATASMLAKLQRRLKLLHDMTGLPEWFRRLEELPELRLSTIDSFFHDLLATEGSILGFGSRSQLTSLKWERRLILREVFNEIAERENPTDILEHFRLAGYDYEKLALGVWDTLHQRGHFGDEVRRAFFGKAEKDSAVVNDTLSEMVKRAEGRYQDLKARRDVYVVSDLKAEVDGLVRAAPAALRRNPFRFIFVDEFQDTDNSQIRSIAWLQRVMRASIFVVGDVKQSIYRFRGAEETAFDELERLLKGENRLKPSQIAHFELVRNYRSSPKLIGKLNRVFDTWSRHEEHLLSWTRDASAATKAPGELRIKATERRDVSEDQIIEHLEEMRHFLSVRAKKLGAGPKVICMLARTNFRVTQFAQLCRSRGILCRAQTEGDFFQSRPVLDFMALLNALLFPNDTRQLWNLLSTPYASGRPDPDKIASLNGNEDDIRPLLQACLEADGWTQLLRDLRTDPFFPLIERTVTALNPVGRFEEILRREGRSEEIVRYDTELYRLNLNKLLRILYEHFAGEYASLLVVRDFLHLKIQTGAEEDKIYPEPDAESAAVTLEAMTVHKAKGLEFDGVLMPYATDVFRTTKDGCGVITEKAGNDDVRVGWCYERSSDGKKRAGKPRWPKEAKTVGDAWKNDLWEKLETRELSAVRRDEARLLYVALTRAKTCLTVLMPREPKENTWTEFLFEHKTGGA